MGLLPMRTDFTPALPSGSQRPCLAFGWSLSCPPDPRSQTRRQIPLDRLIFTLEQGQLPNSQSITQLVSNGQISRRERKAGHTTELPTLCRPAIRSQRARRMKNLARKNVPPSYPVERRF